MIVLVFALAVCTVGWGRERKLLPGDRISITCDEEPSLCVLRTVSEGGSVDLPAIGSVVAAGRTADKLSQAIVASLERLAGAGPYHVTVKPVASPKATVTVLGMVKEPIEVRPSKGQQLKDLVAQAQPTQSADLSAVIVIGAEGKEWTVDAEETNFEVRGGDRIFIPSRKGGEDVSILGGVKDPGTYPYKKHQTLQLAVQRAGGLTARAIAAKIVLQRSGENIPLRLPEDKDFELQKGDVVRVTIRADASYISVSGWVKKPGLVELLPDMKLTQAIEAAGGLAPRASQWVRIRSTIPGKQRDFRANLTQKDPILEPGDSLEVEGQ